MMCKIVEMRPDIKCDSYAFTYSFEFNQKKTDWIFLCYSTEEKRHNVCF